MAFTHSLTSSINSGAASSVSRTVSFSGTDRESVAFTIATGNIDKIINIAIDVDQIKSLYIVSDRDITLETNSGVAPNDTIALKANKPFIYWTPNYYYTTVLTVDVTKMYFTNSSGYTATVYIELLQDPTP